MRLKALLFSPVSHGHRSPVPPSRTRNGGDLNRALPVSAPPALQRPLLRIGHAGRAVAAPDPTVLGSITINADPE
jgi:hypothetical protein